MSRKRNVHGNTITASMQLGQPDATMAFTSQAA